MANLSINNGGVSTNKGSMPNIDLRYGPYASVHAAHAALAADEVNTPGLTVGIVSGNTIVEYWYQGGSEEVHLVPKQSGGGGASAPTEVAHTGASVTIATLEGNSHHTCSTALTDLTISALGNTAVEATIEIECAEGWTGATWPTGARFAPARPMLSAGKSYVVSVHHGIITACEVTQ